MRLFACALVLAAALPASPSPASIGGQVFNSATDQPVNGVLLVLTALNSAVPPLTFTTEIRGLFLFENLTPGRYMLFAESDGFARQAFGSRGNSLEGVTLSIGSGQEMNDLQFTLSAGSSISGKVLDAAGNSVPKAAVLALQPIYQRGSREYIPVGSAVSGADGAYRLANLSAGRYLVSASTRNGEGVTTFFPNTAAIKDTPAIVLSAGDDANGKDIRLLKAPMFHVSGRLAAATPGAVLAWLTPKGAAATALASRTMTAIDADGSFTFPAVAAGAYFLSATEADGIAPVASTLSVNVSGQNVDGLILKPQATGELHGTVSLGGADAQLPKGMQVVLEAADWLLPKPPRAAVGDDGKFTVKNLAPGRYVAHLQIPEGLYVRSVRYRGLDVTENGFEFGGGEPAPLLISLSAGAVVQGAVRGADGSPMPGAVVALVPSLRRYSRYKEATTDQNGTFAISGIAPGEYKVYSWDEIETGAYQNADWLKRYELKGRSIVVKQDGHEMISLKAIQF